MKIQFREQKFTTKIMLLLNKIIEILNEFEEQGLVVTLRQLYYQLVSRDIIPNKVQAYNNLSNLLTNARYGGVVDWNAIEDRVRVPKIPNTFDDIDNLIDNAILSYQLDRWEEQEYHVELWTEKDALSSVIYPLTRKWQIPFVVNRGYTSASAMFESAERLKNMDKKIIILYLGDHDPSGLDMIRDIRERLDEFGVEEFEVKHIGITMEQIEQYNPPENPAKITDPRAKEYISNFGNKSWEVDALRPDVLQGLIEDNILTYLDMKKFEAIKKKEQRDILLMKKNLKKKGAGDNNE